MSIVSKFVLQGQASGFDQIVRQFERMQQGAQKATKPIVTAFNQVSAAASRAAMAAQNAMNPPTPPPGIRGWAARRRARFDSQFGPAIPNPPSGGGGNGSGGGGGSGRGGGFGQGLLQGALSESFIGRGPGNIAQAAGLLAGRSLLGSGRAVTSAMTGDLGGTVAGLASAVPIFGGAIGAFAQGGINQVSSALQYRAAQGRMGPYLARTGTPYAQLRSIGDIMGKQGNRFGMSSQEGLETAVGAVQQAGGTLSGMGANSVSQILAAQQLGIGGGNAATLLRGAQTGAMVGGGVNTQADMLTHAVKMGFQGSEVTEYFAQMADDIRSFKTTGMPLQQHAIDSMAEKLVSQNGISPFRAQTLARSSQQAAFNFSQNGITDQGSGLYAMALGYKPGDLGSLLAAQKKAGHLSSAEKMKAVDFMTKAYAGDQTSGPSYDYSRIQAYRTVFPGATQEEALGKGKGAMQAGSVGNLTDAAAGQVAPTAQRSGAISDKERMAGDALTETVQNYQEKQADILAASGKRLSDALNGIADIASGNFKKGFDELGSSVQVVTKTIDAFNDALLDFMFDKTSMTKSIVQKPH